MSERWSPPSFRRLGSNRSSFFRDFSPESDDMFSTDLPSSWNFPNRNSSFGSRLGDSAFNSFPRRTTMRSFPSHFEGPSYDPFEWHQPSWVKDELRRSRGSSPSDSMHTPTPPGNNSRSGSTSPGINHQSFFTRQNSIPIRVVHESSRQNSRASTPASGTSECSQSKNHFEMQEENNSIPSPDPGLEKHPGISAQTKMKQPHTAKRQPKVHHIPIYVEPREDPPPFQSTPPPYANNAFIPKDVPHEKMEKSSSPERTRSGPRVSPYPSPRMQRKSEPQTSQEENSKPSNEPQTAERVIPIKIESRSTVDPSPKQGKKETKTEIPVNNKSSPTPSAPPVKVQLSQTEIIKLTLNEVELLRPKVESFNGQRGDKQYLYLDEMLTRHLIKLDLIETEGNPELRQSRRSAILKINELIHALENKVKSFEVSPSKTESNAMNMDVVEETVKIDQETVQESKDTVPSGTSEEKVSPEEKPANEHMEVDQQGQQENPAETSTPQEEVTNNDSSPKAKEGDITCESIIPVDASQVLQEPPPTINAPSEEQQEPEVVTPTKSAEESVETTSAETTKKQDQNGELAPIENATTMEQNCEQCPISANEEEVSNPSTGVEPRKFKSIMNVQVTDNSDLPLPPHGTVDIAAT